MAEFIIAVILSLLIISLAFTIRHLNKIEDNSHFILIKIDQQIEKIMKAMDKIKKYD